MKEESEENERIRDMQVVNLKGGFKLQKMKESETIKEYSNKLFGIVNDIRFVTPNLLISELQENSCNCA